MCVSDLLLKLTCIKKNCKYGNASYSKSYLHRVIEVSCIINILSWPHVCRRMHVDCIEFHSPITLRGEAAEASLNLPSRWCRIPVTPPVSVNIPADLSHASLETFSTSQ